MSSKIGSSLGVAIGSALIGTLSLSQFAAASPAFQVSDLAAGYMLAAAAEGKCGEGKCGEGKCGMKKMDANKDGKVSFEEAQAMGMDRAYFDSIDSNGDGFIDEAELKAHHDTMHKHSPKHADGKHEHEAKAAEGSCGGHGAEGGCGGMRG